MNNSNFTIFNNSTGTINSKIIISNNIIIFNNNISNINYNIIIFNNNNRVININFINIIIVINNNIVIIINKNIINFNNNIMDINIVFIVIINNKIINIVNKIITFSNNNSKIIINTGPSGPVHALVQGTSASGYNFIIISNFNNFITSANALVTGATHLCTCKVLAPAVPAPAAAKLLHRCKWYQALWAWWWE